MKPQKAMIFHMDYSEIKDRTEEELAKLLASASASSKNSDIGFRLGCKLLCEREPDTDDKTKKHQIKPDDVDMLSKDLRRNLWFEDGTKQYPLEHYRKIVMLFVGAKYQREREK